MTTTTAPVPARRISSTPPLANSSANSFPVTEQRNDQFGGSIAIDNGVVAVGAHWDDDNGNASGSAYLFDATTGQQLHKLLPSDGAAGDCFGFSIAIANGVVAVGALDDDDNGTASGSAYLFDATTGQQLYKLLPSDGAAGDMFGSPSPLTTASSLSERTMTTTTAPVPARRISSTPPLANSSTNSSPVTEQRVIGLAFRAPLMGQRCSSARLLIVIMVLDPARPTCLTLAAPTLCLPINTPSIAGFTSAAICPTRSNQTIRT